MFPLIIVLNVTTRARGWRGLLTISHIVASFIVQNFREYSVTDDSIDEISWYVLLNVQKHFKFVENDTKKDWDKRLSQP